MTELEHLFCIAGEEGVEVSQRVSKILRFGRGEIQPGQDLNNTERFVQEFNDLVAVMEMLQDAGAIGTIYRPELIMAYATKAGWEKGEGL